MEFDSPEGIRILEALTAETPRRHSFHPADRQLKFGLRQRHSEFRDAPVKLLIGPDSILPYIRMNLKRGCVLGGSKGVRLRSRQCGKRMV